ncbi:hypothetical protein E2C01_086901 [Portunus trituberculatus]|uniref:Uncharacterized protein n=1 Tax=Portunus trituberculatus TaxID=210409 RepID=A0A5B7J222_PORTR|nr:hypothetical protein [Portunus trituberculatus]
MRQMWSRVAYNQSPRCIFNRLAGHGPGVRCKTKGRFTPEARLPTHVSRADFGYYGYVHTVRDAWRDIPC